jgi:hypothetical protein
MPPAKKGGTPPTKPPTKVPTKTGGNGGDDGGSIDVPSVDVAQEDEQPILKRRVDLLHGKLSQSRLPEDYEFSLSPSSLVGSWFHRLENDAIVWQGVVVGMGGQLPQEGPVYLCQIDRLDQGAEGVQRLIPLSRMVNDEDGYDWRFYDSQAEAKAAYAAWIAAEAARR